MMKKLHHHHLYLLYAARQRSCEVVTEYGLEVATP